MSAAGLLARTLQERLKQSIQRMFRLLGLLYSSQEMHWTYLALKFHSGERTKLQVSARLGHHSSACTGKAWFDDLCLIPLDDPRPSPQPVTSP